MKTQNHRWLHPVGFCAALAWAWTCVAWPYGGQLTYGGDWPQILGPQRNGQAENEKLLDRWPEEGPRILWQYPLGSGFAGPAVQGDELYIFHRVGDFERLERIDAQSGHQVWRADFEAYYRGGMDPDKGPRCVPLIHGRHVYVHGAAGDLHCVTRRNGARKWSRATLVEMDGDEGYFGVASTPLVLNDLLLVNVGGSPSAGIVALELETGETAWQQTDERASYSSPVSAVLDERAYAIFVTRYNALAIDPRGGEVRFRFAFGKRGHTVNAAMPLVLDNQLFLTASYGIGSVLTRIDQEKPQTVWSNDQTLSSQYNTPVYFKGHLYGIHGREDGARAELRCVEAQSGVIKWSEPGFGVAHIIVADEKLLVLTAEGNLLLVQPNDRKFTPLAQTHIVDGTTRALPALADGKLYLRDHQPEQGTLMCLQVGVD